MCRSTTQCLRGSWDSLPSRLSPQWRRMVPSQTVRILGLSNCLQMFCHSSSSNPRRNCAPSGTDQFFRCLVSLQRFFDLNEARATHWSIAVSPGAKEKSSENVEDVERSFKCLLVTERGQTCGLTFATWRGLTSHQRRPSGGTHSIRHLASLLTVTNACVLCGTTCKNKWAASDHLKSDINDAFST